MFVCVCVCVCVHCMCFCDFASFLPECYQVSAEAAVIYVG